MNINKLDNHQAEEAAALIKRNLMEISSQYYSPEYIASIINHLSAEKLRERADREHIFVAMEEGKIVGTGSLANFGSEEEPSYYGTAVFVKIELHKRGIGKSIMQKLEEKAVELRADKLTVRSAINARIFYEKLGYSYKDGLEVEDDRGNFIMEKAI
ncbi:MAG: GNAT family N-acetyltransferase [Anaerolineae bacterium]|jgi:predicted N-acetyltransferase YhbS|nr:GNAT family N-acetyltransferase [Anaerolineae bacterium]MBT7189832.1 GNAT family N-acetyltransferase [Anaerolineae bacterium]MBT7988881.1 GNAT family N-acetyltransferase [Anaerolineae bacterium]